MTKRFHIAVWMIAIFVCTSLMQFWMWGTPIPYTDAILWTKAAQQFANGAWPDIYSATPPHPGTTITTPTALFMMLGFRDNVSMQLAMALTMSLAISALAFVCRKLRPNNHWWLAVAIFFALNPLYLQMSAPSALAGVLVCLYVLQILHIREHGSSRERSFYLGLTAGILLATRLDTGGGIILMSLPYLVPLVKKDIVRIGAVAALFFAALDPYLWQHPFLHIWSIFHLIGSNTVTPVVFEFHLWATYLAIAAFAGCAYIAYRKPTLSSIPVDYLKWTLAWSALLSAMMLLSKSHPIRYFFPMMAVLEALLPLLIFEYMEKGPARKYFEPLWRSSIALLILLALIRLVVLYTLWVHSNGPLFYRVV